MNYFVTGGTGFIGRFLVPKLLDRGGTVYLLVRPSSLPKVEGLRELWGRLTRWRISWVWYAAGLLPLLLYTVAMLVAGATSAVVSKLSIAGS